MHGLKSLYNSFERLYSQDMPDSEILIALRQEFPDIVNDGTITLVNSECEDGESKISMNGLTPGLYVNIGYGKCFGIQDILNIKNHPDSFLNDRGKLINPFTKEVFTPKILKKFDDLLESVGLGEEPYFSLATKIKKLHEKIAGKQWDIRKTIKALKRYTRDLQEDPDEIPMTSTGVLLTDYIEDEIISRLENNEDFLEEFLKINTLEEYHIIASLLRDNYDVYKSLGRAQRAIIF